MLEPDSRAVLLDQLKPPLGYRLDAGVATTFTLDLTATLVPALGFSSYAFTGATPDPVAALESIRRAADQLDVFCQAGCIAVPGKAVDLAAFVEPMVHQVRRPPQGLFHPKVWFVRYADPDGEQAFRLLVLSRNLTHDRTWDVVVRLDSEGLADLPLPVNRPLGDFLAGLPERSVRPLPRSRSTRIAALADDARRVEWSLPDKVEELTFHFLDSDRPHTVDFTGRRHLVVSPFLNDHGLDLVRGRRPVTVLSRAEQLEQLLPETLDGVEALVMDTMAGIDDGDSGDEVAPGDGPPSAEGSLLSQLHAKLYVVEPHGRAQKARVLLGSANATEAAWRHNVEFLVELSGPRRFLGVDAFLGPDAPFRALTEPYRPAGGAPEDPEEDERRQLENVLRRVGEIRHQVASEHGASEVREYALTVTSEQPYRLPSGWHVTIELLTRPGEAKHPDAAATIDEVFHGVATADITPFVVVRLTSDTGLAAGAVIVADLVGAPEDRLDEVLARQIDTPEKFLRFLYLLLSLGDPHLLALLQRGDDGLGHDAQSSVLTGGGPGVLEVVLRALADRPAVLGDLERLVRRLRSTEHGRQALPDGFDTLWDAVEQARRQLEEAAR